MTSLLGDNVNRDQVYLSRSSSPKIISDSIDTSSNDLKTQALQPVKGSK